MTWAVPADNLKVFAKSEPPDELDCVLVRKLGVADMTTSVLTMTL